MNFLDKITDLTDHLSLQQERIGERTGHFFAVSVDLKDSIVQIGTDAFSIKKGRIEEYLQIRIDKNEIFLKMLDASVDNKTSSEDLTNLIKQYNELTLKALTLYEGGLLNDKI